MFDVLKLFKLILFTVCRIFLHFLFFVAALIFDSFDLGVNDSCSFGDCGSGVIGSKKTSMLFSVLALTDECFDSIATYIEAGISRPPAPHQMARLCLSLPHQMVRLCHCPCSCRSSHAHHHAYRAVPEETKGRLFRPRGGPSTGRRSTRPAEPHMGLYGGVSRALQGGLPGLLGEVFGTFFLRDMDEVVVIVAASEVKAGVTGLQGWGRRLGFDEADVPTWQQGQYDFKSALSSWAERSGHRPLIEGSQLTVRIFCIKHITSVQFFNVVNESISSKFVVQRLGT